MTTGLILAGHGSHIRPETTRLVWSHVDALRALDVTDEVTAAFWKEAPSFHTAIHTMTADDVTIVPLFTAQGYFTRTVIPAEMRLNGRMTRRDGRILRRARTLSEHPYISDVALRRVREAAALAGAKPEQVAVAVIGHSTRREPASRRATEAQVARIRAAGLAAQVEAVYLDDDPEIATIYTLTKAPILVAVPFFLAPGSHTTQDVPRELGLTRRETPEQVNGRVVYYTDPVGVEDELAAVILELAREAGAPLRQSAVGSQWRGFPAAGRDALVRAVRAEGEMRFGQLRLALDEVRRWGDAEPGDVITDPASLRARVREAPFRSLATSTDLPGGWRVPIHDIEQLHGVVETVYPGAAADWAARRRGDFQPNTFAATIARQTGNFRRLQALDRAGQAAVGEAVCANCVRHATWFHGDSPEDTIPCYEPCNHWLSAALERME